MTTRGATSARPPGQAPLDDIDTFARVVEAQSFSRAARALHLPTSTVSRSVARLEASLGVQLLTRTTRALALTSDGAAFIARAGPALASLREAVRAVIEPADRPHGVLRLTAPYDLGTEWIPELVALYLARHPDVSVDVHLSGRTVDLVSEGFDVAIRAGRLRDSTLVAKKVRALEAGLFAAPAYLARSAPIRTPADLAAHEMVLFKSKEHRQTLRLEGPRDATASVEVRGRITTDDFAFVRGALRSGCGVGMLPRFLGHGDQRDGRLVQVLPGWTPNPGGQLHLVYPAAQHVPAKVIAFRDLLLERASAIPL